VVVTNIVPATLWEPSYYIPLCQAIVSRNNWDLLSRYCGSTSPVFSVNLSSM